MERLQVFTPHITNGKELLEVLNNALDLAMLLSGILTMTTAHHSVTSDHSVDGPNQTSSNLRETPLLAVMESTSTIIDKIFELTKLKLNNKS